MNRTDRTQEIVESYSKAWQTGEMDRARALLADDLDFEGSIDRFTSADPLIDALTRFQAMLLSIEEVAAFFEDSEAMLLYDCVTDTPAGRIRTAEYFRVERERISTIRVVFDATRLRPLMSGSSK